MKIYVQDSGTTLCAETARHRWGIESESIGSHSRDTFLQSRMYASSCRSLARNPIGHRTAGDTCTRDSRSRARASRHTSGSFGENVLTYPYSRAHISIGISKLYDTSGEYIGTLMLFLKKDGRYVSQSGASPDRRIIHLRRTKSQALTTLRASK